MDKHEKEKLLEVTIVEITHTWLSLLSGEFHCKFSQYRSEKD